MPEEEIKISVSEEEYRRSGWWHVNDLLSYFECKDLTEENTVWIENWESVQLLRRSLGTDKLLELLNEDSCNWTFKETDGALNAVRR